jgi:hypothetical protein
MVDQSFTMNVNDTLELDYLIEEISRDTIEITDEPTEDSFSVSYISRETGVFNPSNTGTYKLDIKGQTIEIEVTDIPDSAVFRIDATTINASDGDTIQSWDDQIGSNDLSGGDPTYSTTDQLNPVLDGDATDDELINTTPSGLPTGGAERTVIVVFETASTQSDYAEFTYGTNNSNERWSVRNNSGDLGVELKTDKAVVSGQLETSEKHLVTTSLPSSGTSGDITIRDNGTALSPTIQSNEAVNTQLNYISAFTRNGAGFSDDKLAEAIIYDTELTGSTLTDEEQRLADKWGISI